METSWKRLTAILCVIALLITMPSLTILADELYETEAPFIKESVVEEIPAPIVPEQDIYGAGTEIWAEGDIPAENPADFNTETTSGVSKTLDTNQDQDVVGDGAGLTISYKNGYPILEAEDAKVFLAFIFNDSDILKDDLSQYDYYQLITGNFTNFESTEEIDLLIYSFSIVVRDSMKTQESSSTENVTKLSSKLISYLENKMEGMSNLDEEVISEYSSSVKKVIIKGLGDIFCNNIFAIRTGIVMSAETFESIELGINTASDIMDLPSKVKNFTDNVLAAVNGVLYVLQNEFKGRSEYFNSYLSNRPNYSSPDDPTFQLIMDYNAFAAQQNSAYSRLLDVIEGITGKNSWSNHIDTLNHFAEYLYQLEQASFATEPGTGGGSQEPEEEPGEYIVGNGVTADYYNSTGEVIFYSNGGILSKDWISRMNLTASEIKSVKIATTSGKVHLPSDSSEIFSQCENLANLDLRNFNTSNVINMRSMFYDCRSLTNLDLSSFDTSNVTDISWMFYGCRNLTNLDLSSFNTSNVMDMGYMFCDCRSLTNLDIRNFDTSNVTNMVRMFDCESLTHLDLSGFNTSNVTNMCGMFDGCRSLTNLDLSGFNTSNVTNMGIMFAACRSLTYFDLSIFNTSNVTNMSAMFSGCSSLTTLNISGIDTSNVTDMHAMFSGCSSLTTLNISGIDTSNVVDISEMFRGCSSMLRLDLNNFDASNVNDMRYMFYECKRLIDLNLSGFDASNVSFMTGMFYGCEKLKNLDLNGFVAYNVRDMKRMFYKCRSLTSLDLSSFNTSKVTSMSEMFRYCNSLESLNLNGIDTSKVEYMWFMFAYCSSLTNLDLSGFDTSRLMNTEGMFSGCTNLEVLRTPQKNPISGVALPLTMYDLSGNKYTSLPVLSESITLFGLETFCNRIRLQYPADGDRNVDKFTSFGIVWCQPIQYTGTGNAYLYKYDTDQLVQAIPLLADDDEDSSILGYGEDILSHNLLLLNFDNSRLEPETRYYILIDAGALEFCTYDEGIDDYATLGINAEGISGKDEWDFTTNDYQYMKFTNPTDRIPLSICSVLFRPITAKRFYDAEKGTKGTCYGMTYTAGAYSRNYPLLSELCAGRDLDRLDKDSGSTGMSYSLLEYIQLAHMYQYTSVKQEEYYRNKNDYDAVYNAVRNYLDGGTPVQISVNASKDIGHVLLPLRIMQDNDNIVEILVYDCNKPSHENGLLLRSFVSTLTLYRSGGTFTGFSYRDYNTISYEEIDTTLDTIASMAEPVSWSKQKTLVISGLELIVNGFRKIFSAEDGQGLAGDGKYYYWTDDTSLDMPVSDNGNDISMTDGYKEIRVVSGEGTSVSIDLDSQSATVTSDTNEERPLSVSFSTSDGNADIKSITLSGSANTQISVTAEGDGIVLTSTDSCFNDMTVTVDGNDVELNTADFTSSTNSVTVNVDEDNTIFVTEDTDGDGEYETMLVAKEVNLDVSFSHSCSFDNNITLNYYVPAAALTDCDNYRLEIEKQVFNEDGTSYTTDTYELTDFIDRNSGGVDYKVFSFSNIAAKEMGDEVRATLYADRDGITYSSPADEYSVKQYALNRLERSTDESFKTLLVDMLNYGAAAQVYFNYNTSHPANADLTTAQQALGTSTMPELTSVDYKLIRDGSTAHFYAKSLVFDSSVVMKYYMTYDSGAPADSVKLVLTYTSIDDRLYTKTIPASEFGYESRYSAYTAKLTTIAAKDMGCMVTARIFDGDTEIGDVQEYSIESYAVNRLANSTDEIFKELVREMIKYGKSAETYFRNKMH